MFIEFAPIHIMDDDVKPVNAMIIRQKLPLNLETRLQSEIAAARKAIGGDISYAEWQFLILKAYLVGWTGPAFMDDKKPIPLDPIHIAKLDPDDPLVIKAMDRALTIHVKVEAKEEDDPKDPLPSQTQNGSDLAPAGLASSEGESTDG